MCNSPVGRCIEMLLNHGLRTMSSPLRSIEIRRSLVLNPSVDQPSSDITMQKTPTSRWQDVVEDRARRPMMVLLLKHVYSSHSRVPREELQAAAVDADLRLNDPATYSPRIQEILW